MKYYITSKKDGTPVSGALVVTHKPKKGSSVPAIVGKSMLLEIDTTTSGAASGELFNTSTWAVDADTLTVEISFGNPTDANTPYTITMATLSDLETLNMHQVVKVLNEFTSSLVEFEMIDGILYAVRSFLQSPISEITLVGA